MADLDGNVTSCNELIPLNCLPATGRLPTHAQMHRRYRADKYEGGGKTSFDLSDLEEGINWDGQCFIG